MLSLSACGGQASTPPPETFPTTGVVQYRGGEKFTGGIIQFISQQNPNHNISAPIQADGTFTLQTLHENENVAGAIAGPAQVLVTPPIVGGGVPVVIKLPELVNIDPTANNLTIEVERPR